MAVVLLSRFFAGILCGTLLPELKFGSFPCPIPINGYEVIVCKKVVEMILEVIFYYKGLKIKDQSFDVVQ